jgi:O-succinylbenzoic acid--CoA ligase
MMVVRAIERGLQLITVEPSGHPLKSTQEGLPPCIDFAAMVPLQVYNSLQVPEERDRLRHIRHLIIGGGAIDDYLQEALKDFPNAVWSTYGMTETLSHIALRRLNGPTASSWYTPFEGVKLSQTEEGCLIIDAPAVHDGLLVTNDIVELSTQQFRILGRKDNVICSGGIKIQMEEVERLLRPHLSYPYMITRAKDERLGETVVLMIEGGNTEEVKKLCEKVLPRYWQPRRFVTVDHLPLTETGKPARAEAERIVRENGAHPHG